MTAAITDRDHVIAAAGTKKIYSWKTDIKRTE